MYAVSRTNRPYPRVARADPTEDDGLWRSTVDDDDDPDYDFSAQDHSDPEDTDLTTSTSVDGTEIEEELSLDVEDHASWLNKCGLRSGRVLARPDAEVGKGSMKRKRSSEDEDVKQPEPPRKGPRMGLFLTRRPVLAGIPGSDAYRKAKESSVPLPRKPLPPKEQDSKAAAPKSPKKTSKKAPTKTSKKSMQALKNNTLITDYFIQPESDPTLWTDSSPQVDNVTIPVPTPSTTRPARAPAKAQHRQRHRDSNHASSTIQLPPSLPNDPQVNVPAALTSQRQPVAWSPDPQQPANPNPLPEARRITEAEFWAWVSKRPHIVSRIKAQELTEPRASQG